MILETPRLYVRQWRESDYPFFVKMSADTRVMEFYPAPLSASESDALADKITSLIEKNGWGFWALEEKSTGRFIGFTGLNSPDYDLPFNPCVEIGWRLSFEYWGNGFVTEAANEVLKFGFYDLNLSEIVSFATLENSRSRAVMERLGMRNSNEDFVHPSLPKGSHLRRHCLYRLPRDAWCLREQE